MGDVFPPIPNDVTFFGIGQWMKTRFPFCLFGEIRTELTAKQLESQATNPWEGARLKMPFTVEAVTQWVADRYRDLYQGGAERRSARRSSLCSSRWYEYLRWLEVIDRLDLPDIPPPNSR